MASNAIPKLFINAEPGAILTGPLREFCRQWQNQTEVTVAGSHFIQEDSGRHRHVNGFGAADRLIADDAHFA